MTDLSWKEDLNVGIMNLISIEEHAQHSYLSSKNVKWLDLTNEIRKIRTRWMQITLEKIKGSSKQFYDDVSMILGFYYILSEKQENEKDQFWCIAKHLLAASMRGSEVGTKFLEMEETPGKRWLEKFK